MIRPVRIFLLSLTAALLLSLPMLVSGQHMPRPASTKAETTNAAGIITTYAGNGYGRDGSGGFSGDGGAATSAELNLPYGVAIDSAGDLYIADAFNHRIRRVDATTGLITTVAGGGSCEAVNEIVNGGYCGDGGPATSAELLAPEGVALDNNENIFIADTGNSAIRRVDAKTGIITSVAGFPTCEAYPSSSLKECVGVAGYAGDGGPATKAVLSKALGILVDLQGNLYISDTGSNVVRKVTASTGIITTIAGGGSGCGQQTAPNGDGCPALDASLTVPGGIALDATGDLYIIDSVASLSDIVSQVIRVVNAKTGIITTFAGGGSSICNNPTDNFNSGCLATSVVFSGAQGINFDALGNLYVAGSVLIYKVNPNGIITLVAGNGQPGFTGTGGPALSAELDGAGGITFDAAGNIFFADELNNVIREISSGSTPIVAAPAFSPAPGTYSGTQSVTLSDTTSGATIYYTVDGTTPTTSSPQYIASIPVSSTTTINAYAVASGYTDSSLAIGTYTIQTPVPSPGFSILGGTFTSAQTVILSDSLSGATIYYTTNGSTPTTSSTKYTVPIPVSSTESLEAIAVESGYTNSAVVTEIYTITPPPVALPAFSPAGGTYASAQTVTLSDSTSGATIYYTTNGSTATTSSTPYTGPITVSSTETISAIAVETGYNNSGVATAKYIINLPPVATPTFSPAAGTYISAQSVTINDATAGATIYYTADGSTPTTSSTKYTGAIAVNNTETVSALAVATNYTNSQVVSASYTINIPLPVAATPTFSPSAGIYASAQSVTLSDSTTGATIYYTTDGTSPTTGSTKFIGPIAVANTETVSAIAVASGYTNSGVGTASYVINLPPADFAISLSPVAFTLASGKNATATLTATPTNGFSQAIAFSCSGLPSNDSCSFSPSTITPAGAPAATTLTVAESATAASRPPSAPWPGASGETLALAFCWLGWKKRRKISPALFALALMIGLGAFVGCGGVTPSTTSPAPTTYNVTVTATSGLLSHTTLLAITQ